MSCLTGISERVADIKTRAHAMKCLTTFSEAVGPGFIFERVSSSIIVPVFQSPLKLGKEISPFDIVRTFLFSPFNLFLFLKATWCSNFVQLYKIMKEHKNPKVLSEGLLWMVSAVEDFGISHLKLKVTRLLEFYFG